MQWSWADTGINLNAVKQANGTMVQHTVVLEMMPEYDGRQLKCDVTYDKPPTGTYPSDWDFDTLAPDYSYRYTTPGRFEIWCKYSLIGPSEMSKVHFWNPFSNLAIMQFIRKG